MVIYNKKTGKIVKYTTEEEKNNFKDGYKFKLLDKKQAEEKKKTKSLNEFFGG